MSKNSDKKTQLYISNEGLCGPSIPISRAEFEKARNEVIKNENKNKPQNQNNKKPENKSQQ